VLLAAERGRGVVGGQLVRTALLKWKLQKLILMMAASADVAAAAKTTKQNRTKNKQILQKNKSKINNKTTAAAPFRTMMIFPDVAEFSEKL